MTDDNVGKDGQFSVKSDNYSLGNYTLRTRFQSLTVGHSWPPPKHKLTDLSPWRSVPPLQRRCSCGHTPAWSSPTSPPWQYLTLSPSLLWPLTCPCWQASPPPACGADAPRSPSSDRRRGRGRGWQPPSDSPHTRAPQPGIWAFHHGLFLSFLSTSCWQCSQLIS